MFKICFAVVIYLLLGFQSVYAGVLSADKDTISLYHFDEFNTPVDGKPGWTRDASPNKLDICYINAIKGPTDEGKYGKAVEFDKKDKHGITCPSKGKFEKLYEDIKAITVEMWFYYTGENRGDIQLRYECLISQTHWPDKGFMANWGEGMAGQNIWVQMRTVDGQNWHRLQGRLESPVTLNEWHHFAFTWDEYKTQIYIDGSLVAYKDLGPGEEINLAPVGLWVGSRDGAEWFLSGRIDELRISKIVRTPEEIAASADKTK